MDFQAFVNSEPYKDEKYKKADSRFSFNRKLLKNRSFDYFYKVIRLSMYKIFISHYVFTFQC